MKSALKTLTLVLFACFFLLTTCKKEALKVAPTVSISSPTNITSNSVSVSSNISSDGGSEILSRGVCWSITGEPTTSDNKTSDGKGTGSYTSSVTSLSPGTSYNLKSYAVNGAGTAYSSTATFKTLSLLATVSTTDASAVTSTTLNAGGNISNDGGSDVTARGVCWSTNQNPTISDNKTTDGTGKGVFSSSVTALAPGTTYYFRAYATNGIGTSYGNQISLTVSATLPTITTAAVSNIGPTSAVAGGNITFNGGESITERGVYWGTTATPETNGNKLKIDATANVFEATILNINPNSTYYIKAYATNSKGTAFGNPVTFKTKDLTMAIVDISKESEWKYWIVDKNGDYFYMKENSLKPTVVLLKTASSDSSIPIFMDAQGLPEKIMINDYIFIFGNYNGKNVDVAVIQPNGNIEIAKNVETQVNWDLYKQKGGNAANVALVNLTGRVAGAIPCALSVAATVTTSGATWPLAAWKCGTYLFTLSAEIVEEDFNVINGFADFAKYFGAAKMITGCSTDIVGCQTSMASISLAYLADQMKISDQKSVQINSAKQLLSDGAKITTSTVTSFTSNSAFVGGSIATDGVAAITERGVYYGISNSPEVSGKKFQIGSGAGNFSSTLSGLNAGTTYFVKAYFVKSSGTIYGSQVSFTTVVNQPPSQPSIPDPPNNATRSTSPTLSWTCTDPENDPLTYDVYFGTMSNPTTKISSDQTAKSYSPANLTADADYYWKIVAKDNKNNSTTGPVWKFTTTVAIPGGSVTDADGNKYSTVIIGTQEWMASNLKTTRFKDGTAIPLVTDGSAWANLRTPGYCWYNNDAATNKNTYGALYIGFTVNTSKLCPFGWQVPSDDEWTTLTTYLEGAGEAGGKLKETGTSHWLSPNTGATNTTFFSALPGGYRYSGNGGFDFIGYQGLWWSYSDNTAAWIRSIYNNSSGVTRRALSVHDGFSVRCIKRENHPPSQPSTPDPANNAVGTSTSPTLSWTCTDPENDPLTYDVYFGSTSNPTTKVSAGQTAKSYSPAKLAAGADYYWKIVAKDNENNTTVGPVWKFTTNQPPSQPASPSPANNAKDINPLEQKLSWVCTDPENDLLKFDVYLGTTSNPYTKVSADQTANSFSPTNLAGGGIDYYWKIVAKDNNNNSTTSPVWKFTTMPFYNQLHSEPTTPYPANNATGISLTGTLSWTCTDPENDPLTYDVYFGTTTNPTTKVSADQTDNIYIPKTYLSYGIDYYWKIVAKDKYNNSTTSPVWKFTTIPPVNIPPVNHAPSQPTAPYPANFAVSISTKTTLTWTCTDPENDPLTYDVYFGTTYNPTMKVSADQTARSYSPTSLAPGADYYWRVVVKDNKGNSETGSVWKFTTVNQPPTQPTTPIPANNATGISTSPTLSWTCTDPENDPLTFDVYFGFTTNPTTRVSYDQTAKSYTPANVANGADYYWKIVAKDNKNNSTTGEVWKFTTLSILPSGSVTDADGNTYSTFTIGTQEWMGSNLKTTKYKDGTTIPLVTDNSLWESWTPGYCWYNNDASTNKNTYGALYNWFAVQTGKLCPTGWHVPTDPEWTILSTFLGGESVAGGKLKEPGTSHWSTPNTGATNASGFKAVAGGMRSASGIFLGGGGGHWWSSTKYDPGPWTQDMDEAWYRTIRYDYSDLYRNYQRKLVGCSVRCLRD